MSLSHVDCASFKVVLLEVKLPEDLHALLFERKLKKTSVNEMPFKKTLSELSSFGILEKIPVQIFLVSIASTSSFRLDWLLSFV